MSTRLNSRPGNAGTTRTKYYTFAQPPDGMPLDSGEHLGPITLAYETYGQPDETGNNAILLLHALSGDAHAAGISEDDSSPSAVETALGSRLASETEVDWKKLGWWDNMVGPGKAFDTDRYFVICSNIIGGCRGSSGPSSLNPNTGRHYGLQFPVVTIADMVRAQKRLIEHLGLSHLLAVAGGSMGGHQALEWAVAYPEMVRACIPIASSARLSAQGIAFNEVGRQAIMSDPNWRGGDYYGKEPPAGGLAVARMIGHVTYLSEESMHQKFGRQLRQKERFGYNFSTDFEVESYLRHQGEVFVQRFDANSYLYITKAIDYFDLANGYGSLVKAFSRTQARFLIISFSSDWLYPPHQSYEMVRALKICNRDVSNCDIKTSYGHDAFLLEEAIQTEMISSFLARTYAAI